MSVRFNHIKIAGFAAEELQADEIRTFVGNKKTPSWVFVTIEVWSRLWPSTVTGRRSHRNTHALFRDLSRRMNFERLPLIVTDGFEFYQKVIRRFFGPACLYGQVLKTRRNDRIIKVERKALLGAAWRFDDALNNSEDSSTLNTSFIERLNLTIRQSSAYLSRRTFAHARSTERLDEHLELLRCYYNFVRPHGALKFGREIRTPAMQAGLTHATAHLSRHLLGDDDSFVGADRGFPAHWGAQPGLFRTCTTARSRVATLDGGSTPLGMGLTAKYTSSRRVSLTANWDADAYWLVDAYVRFSGEALSELLRSTEFSIVANNLLDKAYLSAITENAAWLGAPQTISMTATISF